MKTYIVTSVVPFKEHGPGEKFTFGKTTQDLEAALAAGVIAEVVGAEAEAEAPQEQEPSVQTSRDKEKE